MILAIDAGGTSTRAVLLAPDGRAVSIGRAGGGNPTSVGIEGAVDSIAAATAASLAAAGSASDSISVPSAGGTGRAVIAMAGEQTDAFRAAIADRMAGLGFGSLELDGDLLGTFHSGTPERAGAVLIAGTGTVAARVRDGRLDRIAGGNGWLLGDEGGGFWIGNQVARAVVADLDGIGPATAMTPLVLELLSIGEDREIDIGRPRMLRRLVSALYGMPPIDLARLATLAFAASDDPVAAEILTRAAKAIVVLLDAVRDRDRDEVVVLGGSVLMLGFGAHPEVAGPLRPLLDAEASDHGSVRRVHDGLVGAAVLALRSAGVEVVEARFARLAEEIAGLRPR